MKIRDGLPNRFRIFIQSAAAVSAVRTRRVDGLPVPEDKFIMLHFVSFPRHAPPLRELLCNHPGKSAAGTECTGRSGPGISSDVRHILFVCSVLSLLQSKSSSSSISSSRSSCSDHASKHITTKTNTHAIIISHLHKKREEPKPFPSVSGTILR